MTDFGFNFMGEQAKLVEDLEPDRGQVLQVGDNMFDIVDVSQPDEDGNVELLITLYLSNHKPNIEKSELYRKPVTLSLPKEMTVTIWHHV